MGNEWLYPLWSVGVDRSTVLVLLVFDRIAMVWVV